MKMKIKDGGGGKNVFLRWKDFGKAKKVRVCGMYGILCRPTLSLIARYSIPIDFD